MTDAPERIWLPPMIFANNLPLMYSKTFYGSKVGRTDVEYIRADITAAQVEALTKERDEQIAETRTLIRLGDKHREAMIAIQERETTLIKERDALRALLREAGEALTLIEAETERARIALISSLCEPERTAFWAAVQSRDRARAVLAKIRCAGQRT